MVLPGTASTHGGTLLHWDAAEQTYLLGSQEIVCSLALQGEWPEEEALRLDVRVIWVDI